MKSKHRLHTPMKEKQGPGLLFMVVALAAVAMVSARFMGVDPVGLMGQLGQRFSMPVSSDVGTVDVSERGEAVNPVARTEPRVLIYHAHASENYSPKETHARSGSAGDVVEVGRALAAALEAKGIRTIHLTGVYDDPWRDAYTASAQAVRQVLEANPSIEIVLDIHRDAIETQQVGIATVQMGDESAAKILFTVGEMNNPYIQQNAEIASRLKSELDRLYPGMSRGVRMFRQESNGHLHRNAVEVHIGDYYDTDTEEAKATAGYFAEVLSAVLN